MFLHAPALQLSNICVAAWQSDKTVAPVLPTMHAVTANVVVMVEQNKKNIRGCTAVSGT